MDIVIIKKNKQNINDINDNTNTNTIFVTWRISGGAGLKSYQINNIFYV